MEFSSMNHRLALIKWVLLGLVVLISCAFVRIKLVVFVEFNFRLGSVLLFAKFHWKRKELGFIWSLHDVELFGFQKWRGKKKEKSNFVCSAQTFLEKSVHKK